MAPNNVLPIYGNEKTMNLNPLVLANIQASPYFKVHLYELKTYHQVIDEIFYKVNHLEPWEKGSRKVAGQTGMCGGVRGVGTGGIVSSAFCLLYKLYTLKLTRKQVVSTCSHRDSPFIRALGLLYIRYTQPPNTFWEMYEAYLDDEEEVDPKAGGGNEMTIGELCQQLLTKLEWYGTLFPRIPVPIMKDIEARLNDYKQQQQEHEGGEEFGETERQGSERQVSGEDRGAREASLPDEHKHRNASRSGSRDQFGRKKRRASERSPSIEKRSSRRASRRRSRSADRSRERRGERRRGRSDRSRDRSRDKRERSRDKRERSRDKRERSRDKRERSKDEIERSRDKRERSRDEIERSRDKRDSRERSRKREGNRERTEISRDRRDKSRDRRERSRDKRDRSGDRRERSGERRESKRHREGRTRSEGKRDRSTERRKGGREERGGSSNSRKRKRSRERSASGERRTKKRENGVDGGDVIEKCKKDARDDAPKKRDSEGGSDVEKRKSKKRKKKHHHSRRHHRHKSNEQTHKEVSGSDEGEITEQPPS